MTQQTISVTRALVELKRFDQRINQATTSGLFVHRTVGQADMQKAVGSSMSVEEVKRQIQGSFDKVDSLINSRSSIKAALVKSNAETQVQIMGKTMSVAEAIELKNIVVQRNQYLAVLRKQLTDNKALVERNNATLQEKIEVSLNNIYGSDKAKITDELYAAVANPQKKQNEQALLDPSNIEAKIENLTKEISDITSELDFVLSESNARTTVTVDLT